MTNIIEVLGSECQTGNNRNSRVRRRNRKLKKHQKEKERKEERERIISNINIFIVGIKVTQTLECDWDETRLSYGYAGISVPIGHPWYGKSLNELESILVESSNEDIDLLSRNLRTASSIDPRLNGQADSEWFIKFEMWCYAGGCEDIFEEHCREDLEVLKKYAIDAL